MLLTRDNVEKELALRYDAIYKDMAEVLPGMTLMRLKTVYDFISAVGRQSIPDTFEVVTKVPGSLTDSFRVIFMIESVSAHDYEVQLFRDAVLSSEKFRVERVDGGEDAVRLIFEFPAKP